MKIYQKKKEIWAYTIKQAMSDPKIEHYHETLAVIKYA